MIHIGSQRFRCPEALFKPQLMGKDMKGYHDLAYGSIMQSDVDIRKSLYESVILSGGTTMFPGLNTRLQK